MSTRVSVLPAAETVLDVDPAAEVPCAGFHTDAEPASPCAHPAAWGIQFLACGHFETLCNGHLLKVLDWLDGGGAACDEFCTIDSHDVEWRQL